jgi:hypothetical protein
MYDNNENEEWGRYNWQPQPAVDPDYNGGVAPAPPAPRYDYNNGSPPDQALTPGHGWVWEGPQQQSWNAELGQWDRGVWQERPGTGLGFTAPTQNQTPAPQPTPSAPQPSNNGAVAPISANIPSPTLPSGISSLFSQTPQQTPVQSAYQTALLKYLDRSQQTPSLDDPILGPQAEMFRVQQQRNQERNRRSAVERAAVTGQSSSGALDRRIERGEQEQRFNTAQFNAGLLGREMDKKRQELLAALQLASATGNQEATRELQTRLAQVNAMMQQQSLSLQGQLGFGDLALRALMAEMGNDQFYDSLGVNTALGLEGLNQRAVQILGL